MNCVDYLILGVFKHLIYFFVIIVAISFAYMMFVVARSAESDGFDYDIDWHITALSYYIDNHPQVYGVKKVLEKQTGKDASVKYGLQKLAESFKDDPSHQEHMLLHPLYVELH